MTPKGMTHLSAGVYHDAQGHLVYLPKPGAAISSRPDKKNDSQKKNVVRGKEVSVRQSASDGQVLYGKMKIGGVYTFIQTNKNSKAFLVTGTDNSQIVWIARAAGEAGNSVSVTIECTGTHGSITVTVVGDDITVRVKSTSGTSQSTATQVINAIRANGSANALVGVNIGTGNGTGNVQAASTENLQNGGGTHLHQVITLACHEIESVEKLYLDEREVTFGYSVDPRWAIGDFNQKVFMNVALGSDSQTVQPDLQGQVGSDVWSDDHRQRGCANIYLITRWSSSTFANGMPEVTVLAKGKKCYKFSTGTTEWTQNAALIIADFLMNTKYGLGVAFGELDHDNWEEAEAICDEAVTLVDGSTEPRYQINGVFDSSMSPQNVLEEMVKAIAGDIVYQSGKWRCYPAKYRTPTLSLDEDDLRGEVKISTLIPRRDRFNAVKGTYVSPSADYNETDYPAIINSGYAAQDGGTIYANIQQQFVTSSSQCQRVAKIELERVRQGIECELVFSPKALNAQICDVVQFSYDKFGWVDKEFEVRDVSIEDTLVNGLTVRLHLRETASGIFTWSAEETTVDLAPNTTLPDPGTVEDPTDVTLSSGTSELYLRADGTVFSRIKVSWTPPDDEFVEDGGHYEVLYKKSAEAAWQATSNVPGGNTFMYILDVEDSVAYDVRIRAVNVIGTAGNWIYVNNHLVAGKTAPPSNVSSFSGSVDAFGIQLEWSAVSDLDVREYELRIGSSWDTATLLGVIRGTRYRVELKSAATYTFLIKAIDTSGNYSTSATSASVLITGPGAPIVSHYVDGPDLVLTWTPGVGLFSIDSYELRYGDVYSSATILGEIKGTTFRSRVNWGDARTYWVTARDVAGNLGTPEPEEVIIVPPGSPQSATVEPLDNNALIRWQPATSGSLPIDHYSLYKGAVFDTATYLGDVGGTFASQFELEGGTYVYWIVAVDSAENESTEVSVSVLLDEPPDFVFLGDHTFTVDDVTEISKALIEGEPYFDTSTTGHPVGLLLAITYA